MSLATLALVLSGLGVLSTGYLAAIFLADPVSGMRKVHHLPEFLPRVMTDRYISNLLLALAAMLYGDLAVIAVLFSVFAFMSFADTAIYARAGKPFAPHLLAAFGASVVALVAVLAVITGAAQ